MPDHIDALFENANDREAGPDLKDAVSASAEFRIGNRLSDLLEQAEKILPIEKLCVALELMIRPNCQPPTFTHPLLVDIQKTICMFAQATTNAVMETRIRNRVNRLRG